MGSTALSGMHPVITTQSSVIMLHLELGRTASSVQPVESHPSLLAFVWCRGVPLHLDSSHLQLLLTTKVRDRVSFRLGLQMGTVF